MRNSLNFYTSGAANVGAIEKIGGNNIAVLPRR